MTAQTRESSASHFGGVFEFLVKTAKRFLKSIVGNAELNDDEHQTAIKELEALMNSRPLRLPMKEQILGTNLY